MRNPASVPPTAPALPRPAGDARIAPAPARPEPAPARTGPRVSFHRVERAGRGGLGAWVAVPAEMDRAAVPLVAVHGIKRAVREQAEAFAARAAAEGRPVIAPDFDEARWPRFQQVVRHGRADLALVALLEELCLEGLPTRGPVDLFGYSGGAQFAHRFAMLHPQAVRRLTLASAGWYTFPDAAPFPYGLGPAAPGRRGARRADWGGAMRTRLDDYLAIPITIAVGAEDRVADALTRRNPALDAQQGTTRLCRARAYADALAAEAGARGLAAPTLAVLPGAGHDFGACLDAGLAGHVLPGMSR